MVLLGTGKFWLLISNATFFPFEFKCADWSATIIVGASLNGPSVILDTSYCNIELSWLRPKRLPAIDDDTLDSPAWSHDGLCKLVKLVSRQILFDVVGVTFVWPPYNNGLCGGWCCWWSITPPILVVSIISEVIDEFAFDDCLCGFLGPKVVITWNYKFKFFFFIKILNALLPKQNEVDFKIH